MSNLIEFYGTECPHCKDMEPLIERLEKEKKLKIERFEVWHNSKNAALWKKYDKGLCGGVPFFYNKKTGGWICGAVPWEKFLEWAKGKG